MDALRPERIEAAVERRDGSTVAEASRYVEAEALGNSDDVSDEAGIAGSSRFSGV